MEKDKIIYHFELIEDFNKLKEVVNHIDDEELNDSLELINSNDLSNQVKVAEALTKLLNFTDNYNKMLNALNIHNNTAECNKLCKISMEQLQKSSAGYKHSISDIEVRCNDITVNNQNKLGARITAIDREIAKIKKKMKVVGKSDPVLSLYLAKLEKERAVVKADILSFGKKKQILRGEIKPPKSFWNLFKGKEKVVLNETEQAIVKQKTGCEASVMRKFELKYNSLILSNNEIVNQSDKLLGKQIIELNDGFFRNITKKMFCEAYRGKLFESILDKANSQFPPIEVVDLKDIQIEKYNVNLVNYLTFKIQQRNKSNYNDFIATSLEDVSFSENCHAKKLWNTVKSKTTSELIRCKSPCYAIGMVLSGVAVLAKFLAPAWVVKQIEKAGESLKHVVHIYNKDADEQPELDELPQNGVKLIDDMFESFSFKISNKEQFDKYINKLTNVKKVSLHKQYDDFELA